MESFDSQSKWFINATYVDACSQYGCALFPIVSYASLAVAATSCDALIVCGGYDLQLLSSRNTRCLLQLL